jgi:hypothetical protein
MLGVDRVRVEKSLENGTRLWHLLSIKNLALLVIVGLPTLALAVALTLWTEGASRLAVTVPDVAVPILSWLGVGNLISVLLPVGYEPLIRRWRQRRQLRRTMRWLIHLLLPYGLFYLADPVYGAPHVLIWRQLPAALGPVSDPEARGMIHVGVGLLIWCTGIAAADLFVRFRGLHLDR